MGGLDQYIDRYTSQYIPVDISVETSVDTSPIPHWYFNNASVDSSVDTWIDTAANTWPVPALVLVDISADWLVDIDQVLTKSRLILGRVSTDVSTDYQLIYHALTETIPTVEQYITDGWLIYHRQYHGQYVDRQHEYPAWTSLSGLSPGTQTSLDWYLVRYWPMWSVYQLRPPIRYMIQKNYKLSTA